VRVDNSFLKFLYFIFPFNYVILFWDVLRDADLRRGAIDIVDPIFYRDFVVCDTIDCFDKLTHTRKIFCGNYYFIVVRKTLQNLIKSTSGRIDGVLFLIDNYRSKFFRRFDRSERGRNCCVCFFGNVVCGSNSFTIYRGGFKFGRRSYFGRW